MPTMSDKHAGGFLAAAILLLACMPAFGQAVEPVLAQAGKEKPALLETMRMLVSIESGSPRHRRARLAIGRARLPALQGAGRPSRSRRSARHLSDGGHTGADRPDGTSDLHRHGDQENSAASATWTPSIRAACSLEQPFRIDGNRVYGLGIANDKQGIAVILHALAMLRAMDFRQYGTLTVLINGDELISSPGSRSLVTRLGAEHDATLCSWSHSRGPKSHKLSLTTSGYRFAHAHRRGAGVARRRGAGEGYQRALRACPPSAADERFVRPGERNKSQLDHGQGGSRSQNDSAQCPGCGRCPRAARI